MAESVVVVPPRKPVLLVLSSTYPRWKNDTEPGFVHELSKRLTDNFRVIVLCPHASGAAYREDMEGVDVVRYRYGPARLETLVNDGGIVSNLRSAGWKWLLVPGFILMQACYAWRLLRREQVDVIHAHWLIPQGMIAALVRLLPGRDVPFVVTLHGSDVNVLQGRILSVVKRMITRVAHGLTVVSEGLRDSVMRTGIDGANMIVQPMGVDLSGRFVPADVQLNRHEILFVGRLVPGKGVDRLIQAMSIVVVRCPQARLTIVGHGPEAAMLKSLAIDLGILGRITFAGSIDQEQLPGYYRRAGVFVAPFSRNEGFGLVLVEAIGCGCPVIASRVPAAKFILGEDFAALTVDSDDPEALAEKIIGTLDGSSAERQDSSRLRSRAVECFDWSPVAAAYADILADAMGHQVRS